MSNDIISVYLMEQKPYSSEELAGILKCSGDELIRILKRLNLKGIVKFRKAQEKDSNDLLDEDVTAEDITGRNIYHVFTFVGIVAVEDLILKIVPKYINTHSDLDSRFKQVIRVITKYYKDNRNSYAVGSFSDEQNNYTLNRLPVILFLLNDYFEYGLYRKDRVIEEHNGRGSVVWNRTIGGTALITDNRPFYPDMITRWRASDERNIIRQIHSAVIGECSRLLSDSGISDIFGYETPRISDHILSDFGEPEDILPLISKEISGQYNTHNQILLRALYLFIEMKKLRRNKDELDFYGTGSFNLVWEKICSDVFDNKLDRSIKDLGLSGCIDKDKKLRDMIDRPRWNVYDDNGIKQSCIASGTLNPDIICIEKNRFAILDAKYYVPVIDNDKISREPGIYDITKQYMYHMAFGRLIEDNKFNKVSNCFIMPTEQNKVIVKGQVELHLFEVMGLSPVQIRLLPAEYIYDCYLKNEKTDLDYLEL